MRVRDVHQARLLIVDDEPELRRMLLSILRGDGYADIHEAATAAEAMEKALRLRPDAVILDVMLPDGDGFELMEYIRPTGTPVIFLTARTAVDDRVRGLHLGAYDYIVKPFDAAELLARVEGVLRHSGRRDTLLRAWDVVVDPEARTAARNGEPVPLTPHEFDLLLALLHNRGITLYRSALLELVWGMDAEPSNRTLDIHMSRLRRKLGWEKHIRTVPRVGYMLEVEKTP